MDVMELAKVRALQAMLPALGVKPEDFAEAISAVLTSGERLERIEKQCLENHEILNRIEAILALMSSGENQDAKPTPIVNGYVSNSGHPEPVG